MLFLSIVDFMLRLMGSNGLTCRGGMSAIRAMPVGRVFDLGLLDGAEPWTVIRFAQYCSAWDFGISALPRLLSTPRPLSSLRNMKNFQKPQFLPEILNKTNRRPVIIGGHNRKHRTSTSITSRLASHLCQRQDFVLHGILNHTQIHHVSKCYR